MSSSFLKKHIIINVCEWVCSFKKYFLINYGIDICLWCEVGKRVIFSYEYKIKHFQTLLKRPSFLPCSAESHFLKSDAYIRPSFWSMYLSFPQYIGLIAEFIRSFEIWYYKLSIFLFCFSKLSWLFLAFYSSISILKSACECVEKSTWNFNWHFNESIDEFRVNYYLKRLIFITYQHGIFLRI